MGAVVVVADDPSAVAEVVRAGPKGKDKEEVSVTAEDVAAEEEEDAADIARVGRQTPVPRRSKT